MRAGQPVVGLGETAHYALFRRADPLRGQKNEWLQSRCDREGR